MNLFEMMQAAQNGQAVENLARQYGISQQQTQAALDALLPAFSMGLQRQTQDPYGFGNLARMMTATPFGQMYDSNGDGIPDTAVPLGNDVLSQIFGSKEVSNAVTAQAAATSGVGQAILKQMLPVIASMVMGGLFKSASNQGLGGILGQLGQMMGGGQPQGGARPGGQAGTGNPLEAILGGLFGGQAGAGRLPTGAGAGAPAGNPLDMGSVFGQILGGMFGQQPGQQGGAAAPAPRQQAAPASRPAPEPEMPAPSGETGPGSIGLDALNQMFEHGRKVQDSHQDALRSIFDAMLGGGQRRS